jgi:hypothetical protein
VRLAAALNAGLAGAYRRAGARPAAVAGAFASGELRRTESLPPHGTVPVAVARVCRLTWACAPPPRGPDIHPNAAGYRVIADQVLRAAR